MKKVIFRMLMFLTGALSVAMILPGSMANDWTVNGHHSASWNIPRYGLLPALYLFAGMAILGLIVAVWGLFDHKS